MTWRRIRETRRANDESATELVLRSSVAAATPSQQQLAPSQQQPAPSQQQLAPSQQH